MNNTAPKNIVSLSEYDKARKVGSETISLLNECRDMAAELLSKSLSKMLDRIEESLFELAEKALNHDVRNVYLEARGKALAHRDAIESEFRRNFLQGFNKRLVAPDAASKKLDFSSLELSLVDTDDFEATLAVSDIAKRLKNNCNDELMALDYRVSELMHKTDLADDDNPLGPKAICEAFKDACNQLESNVNVKLIILKQFDQLVSDDIQGVYKNLNTHLVNRNVIPVITPDMLRRRASGSPMPRPAPRQQERLDDKVETVGDQPPQAQATEQELFTTLQQLLTRNDAGMAAMLGGLSQNAFAPTSNGGFPELNNSVLDVLSSMQQGNFGAVALNGAGLDLAQAGSGNILRDVKQAVLGQGATQIDGMTIDIVAMLFDYIFDDRQIPDKMKALIGRLQIPVLKVAMLDKKFFSKKSHPARQLLDTLALAALGWNEAEGEGDRLYCKIDDIIHRILSEFEENFDVFESARLDLEAFLAEEERLAQERAESSAKVIYEREWLQMAKSTVEEEVQRRIATGDMPEVIGQFLSLQWGNLLLSVYVKDGVESDNWRNALQTMDDLIWSVQPKRSPEERMRLVSLLPPMLKKLEAALEINQTPKESREKFFAALVQCHASAIKSGMPGKAPEPMPVIAAEPIFTHPPLLVNVTSPVAEAKELVPVEQLGAPPVGASSFELDLIASANARQLNDDVAAIQERAPVVTSVQAADPYDAMAANLKRGAWIEFRHDDSAMRAKLAWVSPMKNMYLFTNRQGLNAMSISLEGLAAKLRSGSAVIVEESALVDRAVSSMLDALKSGAAA
ncbi:hypothetical protein HNQ59_003516 [Chitinivorax tropicus]|uniref:DUF1631 domain-containing protein n=1 Tax=Chitinivorax tropicus TaxID=714531 RepID=A0A840MSY9_9PROT|nr:DUF1631 domain-containing protein [Chitinivorax tropicus]MBB5020199.1 hypothetical protein [Chitinivorax tropicus]